MLKQMKQSILATLVITLLTGLAYPLVMTGLSQVLFPAQAHGSLIEKDGHVVGSALIGQTFTGAGYFHPRPSATTDTDPQDATKQIPAPYNAASSTGSNASPSAKSLSSDVADRLAALTAENPNARIPVPVDLVTTSASGLDPHISPAAAEYQVPRIAAARGIPEAQLRSLVARMTSGRTFGILGEAHVNVLELNLALDQQVAQR
ncbi:potassium-transporting ATPase subunit KdpC [Telmatospirillum siberiense]|uniref:Potassium-transporting ATPase KdpC subunit n=1 Tax=Telmatospirillum siberiense TaxID=382514 RepID=A0A2N3PYC1_9PROT|nr:potassium-transporting ATPase subunit KdpC [Telmatospirillum siberiense]PKU25375.1 potassium-transporting ATPase subunit C [Telmatospirillum siberiense]